MAVYRAYLAGGRVGEARTALAALNARIMALYEAAGAMRVELGRPTLDEELRLLRGTLTYGGGNGFSRQRAAFDVTLGLPMLGASEDGNPLGSRPGAETGTLSVDFSAEAARPLAPWLLLRGGVVGQWSPDSLPLPLRCGFGANRFSRAFDRSYVTGDSCLGARQELAAPAPLAGATGGLLRYGEGFAAVDYGSVWDADRPGLPGGRQGWASLYGGLRLAGGGFVAEASLSRILDGPDLAPRQKTVRAWLRFAARF